jgi:hypothetical protein
MVFSLFSSKNKSPEQQFWEWFGKNEKMLYDFEKDRNRTFGKLKTALSKVHPDLTYEFGVEKDGTREFVISADGLKEALSAVESLYAAAPAMQGWKFTKFRPRCGAPQCIRFNDFEVRPEDIEISVEADGDKAGLTLFIRGYEESRKNVFMGAAFIMLDHAIGEYDMITKVGFIYIKSFEEESTYKRHSLEHLPEMFDEFIKR